MNIDTVKKIPSHYFYSLNSVPPIMLHMNTVYYLLNYNFNPQYK